MRRVRTKRQIASPTVVPPFLQPPLSQRRLHRRITAGKCHASIHIEPMRYAHHMSKHIIKLTIATVDRPGKPVPLDDEAIRKMASVPPVLRSLAKSYRSKLKSVEIIDAEVIVTIEEQADLVHGSRDFVENLIVCARRISDNAQCSPPLPLQQVTGDASSVDLLRALAKEGAGTGLRLTMETDSGIVELPCLPLDSFVEPDHGKSLARPISSGVIGVCRPMQDANAVVLGNGTLLELPHEHYPCPLPDLVAQVFDGDCRFAGSAELIRAGVLRALPGGSLACQLRLNGDSGVNGRPSG